MATLVESDVEVVQIIIGRDIDGNVTVHAQARSVDSEGQPVRVISRDITGQLAAAQLTSADAFITNLTNRLKTLWQIS